jgi:DNA-binding beta-propeller fold protein YncE
MQSGQDTFHHFQTPIRARLHSSPTNGAAGSADGNVDTVSVIDLDQNPPRVIDHVVVGDAPEGLAISPKGDLAFAVLVAGNSNKKAFFSRVLTITRPQTFRAI